MEKIMRRSHCGALLLVLLMFCMPLISGAPPVTQVQQFTEGYTIVESQHEYLTLNEDYQYNFFVYNTSTGLLLDNTTITCNFFLANSYGEVILSSEVTYFSDGHWGLDILGGNFSQIGAYPYGVSCQDGNGGALAGIFEVTLNGKAPPEGITIVVFTLIFIAIFGFGLISFLKALGNVLELNMDIIDVAIMMATYFSMWIFYLFSMEYLGNTFVNEILELAVTIGAYTHVFLPLVGFLVSFILSTLKFKQKSRVTY